MTVAELIEVLSTLPPKMQDMEVTIDGGYSGPSHIAALEIPYRRINSGRYPHLKHERTAKKLHLRRGENWQHVPDEWCLKGPWPEEAGEIGLEGPQ